MHQEKGASKAEHALTKGYLSRFLHRSLSRVRENTRYNIRQLFSTLFSSATLVKKKKKKVINITALQSEPV